MIVYDLTCDNSHPFEGWFGSADDFALQAKAGDIACPVCGSIDITRELSAPYVKTGSDSVPVDASPSISVTNAAQELKKKFIEHVLSNTENVGRRFPEEARKIFYQEAPERAIRGTASGQEVSELKEEGIDVMAIPAQSLPDKLH
jgi:hypothetical protein